MNKTEMMNKLNRGFNKAVFKIKKHSPTILVVGGVIGMASSGVMACKATTKLQDVLEKKKSEIEQVRDYIENEGFSDEYTEEDSKKDLAILHIQTAAEVAKLYAPAVTLGVVSAGCIFGGHKILHKRNAAIAAAYTAIDRSFKEYRGRVIERFGKELDRELKFNIKSKEVEEIVVDENGEEKIVKSTVDVVDPTKHSDFARFFDEYSENWTKDPETNLMFLRQQQNYFNDKLKRKGYIFLNEVYESLGLQPTKAGQVVGWVYDEKHPVGDNFIDFGIYDLYDSKKREFVNGLEKSVLLDFNVDGEIWDLLH